MLGIKLYMSTQRRGRKMKKVKSIVENDACNVIVTYDDGSSEMMDKADAPKKPAPKKAVPKKKAK